MKKSLVIFVSAVCILFFQVTNFAQARAERPRLVILPSPTPTPTAAQLTNKVKPASEVAIMSNYDPAFMNQFWYSSARMGVINQVMARTYSVDAINDYQKKLVQLILARYDASIDIRSVFFYCGISRSVPASSSLRNKVPTVSLYVPTFMDLYANMMSQKRLNWESEYEVALVASLLHELEHIARDPSIDLVIHSEEERYAEEARAWSETCANVLTPFSEQGYTLALSENAYLRGWQNCGKQNNACWRQFITGVYSQVRK